MKSIQFLTAIFVTLAGVFVPTTHLAANVYDVDSFADDASMTANQLDGRVTLREAIMAASTNLPFGDAAAGSATFADSIRFKLPRTGGVQVIRLTGDLVIEGAITIVGPRVSLAGNQVEIDGQGQHRIFRVRPNAYLRLANVNLSHGNALDGGLINVVNAGLVVDDVEFSNGEARNGGAVFARNTQCSFHRCTFRDNLATRSGGGVYMDYDGCWLENCTFARNHADLDGGAILLDPRDNRFAISNIMSCTIVDNTSGLPGVSGGEGAGIFHTHGLDQSFTMIFLNTIVANNTQFNQNGSFEESDLICNPFIRANNFIGFASSQSGVVNGNSGNQVGTSAQPLNPRLFPLAFNGGKTQNFFPRSNSAVLNAGGDEFVNSTSDLGIIIATDQLNRSRIRGSHLDIGSVER